METDNILWTTPSFKAVSVFLVDQASFCPSNQTIRMFFIIFGLQDRCRESKGMSSSKQLQTTFLPPWNRMINFPSD